MVVLIGNFFGLISSLLKVSQGYVKTKKSALGLIIAQQSVAMITCLLLGSYTGATYCVLNVTSSLLSMRDKLNTFFKILFTVILCVVTILLNTDGFFGWLPFLLFSAYMFLQLNTKNMVKFKTLDILCTIGWCVHDVYYKSYVNVVFNIIAIVSNTIGIFRVKRSADEPKENEV